MTKNSSNEIRLVQQHILKLKQMLVLAKEKWKIQIGNGGAQLAIGFQNLFAHLEFTKYSSCELTKDYY